MLSRRLASARSTLESQRGAKIVKTNESEELMLSAKTKLLDVADRLNEIQDLLKVRSREENPEDAKLKKESSSSFELLSFSLSNAAGESLSESPLSIYSPDLQQEEELQSLLQPVPTGLLSVPNITHINSLTQSNAPKKIAKSADDPTQKTALVFLPIINTIANNFEGLVMDKDAIQTQRTTDEIPSPPESPGGWSDEFLPKLEERVNVKRPEVRRSRGDLLCRFADLSNNAPSTSPSRSDDPFDDSLSIMTKSDEGMWDDEDSRLLEEDVTARRLASARVRLTLSSALRETEIEMQTEGWEDEPSCLLSEYVSAIKRTGEKVKVPPLNLGGLPPSPIHLEHMPLKSSHRLSRFASARSTESTCLPPSSLNSIMDLCGSLDRLSAELIEDARGTRFFADTMHAKVLRLTDDLNRAQTRYADLVIQIEELERTLGASLASFNVLPEMNTPSMSVTPGVPSRAFNLAPIAPSPLSEELSASESPDLAMLKMKEHHRDESNLTTQASSPHASQGNNDMAENGNDAQTPSWTAVQIDQVGTHTSPGPVLKVAATSPVRILQRDSACLAKPSRWWQRRKVQTIALCSPPSETPIEKVTKRRHRQWMQTNRVDELPTTPHLQTSQCSWLWLKTLLLRGATVGDVNNR